MPKSKMNRANIFMGASWAGLGALVATTGIAAAGGPVVLGAVSLMLAIASSIVMFTTRRADEYTEGLWNAGASVAFGTMLLSFLGLPFAEGVYDGATGAKDGQNIPAIVVSVLAIVAFYIGLFIKRLLGDR